jgi:hypothetical protein
LCPEIKDSQAVMILREEGQMRSLEIAIITIIGFFAATAQAADNASPIFGALPDPVVSGMKQYLFVLKKNDILLWMNGDDFCKQLDYGKAVLSDRNEIKDNTLVQGPLNWVICEYKGR